MGARYSQALRLTAMHGRTVELVTHLEPINSSILALSHGQQHRWSVVRTGGTAQLAHVRSTRELEDLQMVMHSQRRKTG